MMFKSAVFAALTSQAAAAIGFVEWWKIAWCDFGGMYNFREFACGTQHPYFAIIPATQRTNNVGGYSMDVKIWAEEVDSFS